LRDQFDDVMEGSTGMGELASRVQGIDVIG